MADNTLTLTLEGEVLLQQFASTIQSFSQLVELLSREVADGTSIQWVIEELQAGSATATVIGLYEEEEPVLNVIRAYNRVGRALQFREPIPFSPAVQSQAIAIARAVGEKITAVHFETADEDFVIYNAFRTEDRNLPKVSFGAVRGRVQALSSRGKLKFTLYDSVFDKSVSCYLRDGQEDLMREIWGKNVVVTGRITRESDRGRVVSVRQITDIQPVLEIRPGSYRQARGVFAWAVGDEPAEVTIRRGREIED